MNTRFPINTVTGDPEPGRPSAPSPHRLPRPRAVLAEQFETGGFWGKGMKGRHGKRVIPWLMGILLLVAAYFAAMDSFFGGRPDRHDPTVADPLLFFPGMGMWVTYAGLLGGLQIWFNYPRNHFQSLPVQQRTHELLRVLALWAQFVVAALMVLVAGGFYALLLGHPEQYLTELPIYLPVVLVAGTILYLLAAALSLATRWSGMLVIVVVAVVVSFSLEMLHDVLPGRLGGLADHVLIAFGMLPLERLAALDPAASVFPYGAWLPSALAWLLIGVAAVYLAAGRHRDSA